MNKIYLTAFLSILTFIGCSKSDTETLEKNQDTTFNVQFDFQVEVKNDMLSFPTREDYDLALDYLGPMNSQEFEVWENKLGFKSMRSVLPLVERESIGIFDDLLATLLNKEGVIEISGNVLKLNSTQETVSVIDSKEYDKSLGFKNKNSKIFSTDDNVLDILEGIEKQPLALKSRYCPKRKLSWHPNSNVASKVVYQKAGFLNSLVASIQNVNGAFESEKETFGLSLITVGNNFWRNKKRNGTFSKPTSSATSSRKSYRPYYSSRRLTSYRFSVEFKAQEFGQGNQGSFHKRVVTIDCN
ncbi:hypothetical protein [Flagellimonas sp. CMM7]|uniref:hypothetical protein n=1 Tax=Flagellimonas sp. CMM7 TaxID=2654676 RepID=UPI0013D710F8|nr:hypothetical protein [Flagellimonas sp. CMM7]UII81112.1 hypothetical protein LV704_06250 [Flagellimonas sp. CMM7]